MYSTHAATRIGHEGSTISQAITGATAMRAAVIALGRFTWTVDAVGVDPVMRARAAQVLGEGFEDQLAHGLERIEHAVAAHGNGLEVCSAFDPFA